MIWVAFAFLYLAISAMIVRHFWHHDPEQPLWIVIIAHVIPSLLWLPIAIISGAFVVLLLIADGGDDGGG